MELATIERGYYSYPEATAYTGLSEDTLRRLARAGKLKAIQPSPRRVLFLKDDLDRLLQGSERSQKGRSRRKKRAGSSDQLHTGSKDTQ